MKTRKEIEMLKENWESDPCWDIENTEGFEEYKQELLNYRIMVEREEAEKESRKIHMKCEKYNCNIELLKLIESLQYRIGELENKVNDSSIS